MRRHCSVRSQRRVAMGAHRLSTGSQRRGNKTHKKIDSRFDVHLLSTQDPQWCVLVRRAVRGRHLALALAYHEGLRDKGLAENI